MEVSRAEIALRKKKSFIAPVRSLDQRLLASADQPVQQQQAAFFGWVPKSNQKNK